MIKVNNFPKIDVVILAGGKGSRIKKLLNGSPKPMMKINKRDFIDYIIKKVSSYPINKIYIMCGYRGKKIYKKYNNTFQNLVPISCIIEKAFLQKPGLSAQVFYTTYLSTSITLMKITINSFINLFSGFLGRWHM